MVRGYFISQKISCLKNAKKGFRFLVFYWLGTNVLFCGGIGFSCFFYFCIGLFLTVSFILLLRKLYYYNRLIELRARYTKIFFNMQVVY